MRSKKRRPPRRQYRYHPDLRYLPRCPVYVPGAMAFSMRRAGICDACIDRFEATASELVRQIGGYGEFKIPMQGCCSQIMSQYFDDWQARLDARIKRLTAERNSCRGGLK